MYDRRSIYLTFGGPLATSDEWNTGLHFAHPEQGTGDHNVTQAEWNALINSASLAADIQTLLTTWFQSGTTGAAIGALAQLAYLKLAYLDTDGHYISDPPFTASFGPVSPPVTTTLPPQVSYVVSLRSGLVLGEANYGRMYMPPPTWAVGQNNGLATVAEVASARNAARTLINGITARIAAQVPGARPCIMSKKGAGTTKSISQIGIGQVLDTQRRRRNKLSEATVLVAL